MIGLITFIVGMTIFNVALTALKKAHATDYLKDIYSRIHLFGNLIAGGLLIIAVVLSGVRIIDTTEVGVVRRWGEIHHSIEGGLNLVNPISDTVTTYDLKIASAEASFASYTKDAQPVTGAIEYQYSLSPSAIMDTAREYGSQDALQAKLSNVIEEKTKIVFSKYGAMTLLENRSNLSAEVMQEVKPLEDLFNIRFSSVIIRDIDFSDAFEASVEAKMEAEQTALKAEQEKKTAVIKAEQAKEVAQINAEAQIAAAEGEAKALEIKQQALNKMPENWIAQLWIEKWNGELPQFMTNGDSSTAMMISPAIDNQE